MGKSSRLRLSDVRGVFRLLNEIQERRYDPVAWQRHMISGLCDLVGARQGAAMRFAGFIPDGPAKLDSIVSGGWTNAFVESMWKQALTAESCRVDAIIDRATRVPRRLATRLREQLISDEDYFASAIANELGTMSGVYHELCAWFHVDPPADAVGMTLHRMRGQRRFNLRERNIVHLFNVELHRLMRDEKLPARGGRGIKLTSRQQEVLRLLLQGDGEKQVARKLGISRYTVNDHVKAIYRNLGVNSRGEMMAKVLRPGQLTQTSE